ncbi:unnamed protein product [Acanthoscelides obtectus]|uniref:Uncharacterized protein n=1 Tax=Acanthoscelides obtectus TaxID=200917 RepID=A0A9P0KVN7_ACAOB|nr:unnamed protein product [Acanthoscelides obtectus]CAK1626311.1 hypothetical protein AOBTE_LOCUS3768 [Acanthoscelides obtectus]
MGKKKQRKNKKARANEFLSITSMPDKNEDRSEQSQSGKRRNDGEGSQRTTAPRSSTASRETKQSSSLNDSGLDDSRETAESESVTRSGIDTKLTASEPVDLYGNHTVDPEAPAILTEQVMRLDIQHNTDQSFGLNLNADAPVFIPTFNEKSTSDVAVSSCDWDSHPSMNLKPTLSEQSDYASCQSTNFSNANRHSNKAGPVDSSSQDSRKPGVRCKSHEVSKHSDLSDDCTTAVDEEKYRSKSAEKTRKGRSKSRDRKSEKKHRSKSRSKEQTNADDCRESKDMNYGSHSDRIDLPSESKKRNRGKNSSFGSQHHDQEKDTRSDNTSADNWRSKDHRQSCDSFNRDKTGPPQGRSLGDGRQTKKFRDPRMERGGKSANWRDDSQNEDSEYKLFEATERSNKEMKYVRVEEKTTDLFEMPKEYSLGHCVAEDLSMGSGIAVHFKGGNSKDWASCMTKDKNKEA